MPSNEQLNEMKAFVVNLLHNRLPDYFCYHNIDHTLYVADAAIKIGREEGCTEEELVLIHTAGLWHDTGCVVSYISHEREGCKMVREYLPGYGFSENDIQIICGMIMATRIPQSPQTKLEKIIADADLEYLGTDHVAAKAHILFQELRHSNATLTEEKWNSTQIKFLQQHHYFTAFCREQREPGKQKYMDQLMKAI
jgi:uncharacterized protein